MGDIALYGAVGATGLGGGIGGGSVLNDPGLGDMMKDADNNSSNDNANEDFGNQDDDN